MLSLYLSLQIFVTVLTPSSLFVFQLTCMSLCAATRQKLYFLFSEQPFLSRSTVTPAFPSQILYSRLFFRLSLALFFPPTTSRDITCVTFSSSDSRTRGAGKRSRAETVTWVQCHELGVEHRLSTVMKLYRDEVMKLGFHHPRKKERNAKGLPG